MSDLGLSEESSTIEYSAYTLQVIELQININSTVRLTREVL